MELKQCLHIVNKWLWLIACCTLVAAGVSYMVSSRMPPVYRASTSLLVSSGGLANNDYSSVMVSERLATNYVELLTSRTVLGKTASNLGLDPLRARELLMGQRVAATLLPNTSVVRLTVEDGDPRMAMQIANGIVEAFRQTLRELGGARSGRDIFVVEPAAQPLVPAGPNTRVNTLVAAVLGFSVAIGVAFLVEQLGQAVVTAEDVRLNLSLPTLAVVPCSTANLKSKGVPTLIADSVSPVTEAYRILRTQIQFARIYGALRTLVIAGSISQDESVNVMANLSIVMAQAGLKVLLVDADLRQPRLHQIFGLAQEPGQGTSLSNGGNCKEHTLSTDIPNLLLYSGQCSSPELLLSLGSEQMIGLIEELKQLADIVIFNTPPILTAADTALLASLVDGTILVVDSQSAQQEEASKALEMLRSVGARVLGAVLSNA